VQGSLPQRIVQRVFHSALVLLGVSTLVFLCLRLAPGDPIDILLGEQALEVDRASLRACLRLDRSLLSQYGLFLGDLLDGSMGRFCHAPDRTVAIVLVEVLPYTVQLASASLLLALLVSIPLGCLAAVRARSAVDTAAVLLALVGVSVPAFWSGPLLLLLFCVLWPVLPAPGTGGGPWAELLLPAITLAAALAARLTRITRASLLDVLGQDYVRTARARGLSERVVVLRHALQNALIPVLSVIGLQLGGLLAGAIIVEKVFARPGLGSTLLLAVEQRDYALVQGAVLAIAFFYVLANALTDLLYGMADPRLRGGHR
jgi:ABC-type dipeptide/oligopeptide/nickel transport system permease component